MGLLDIAALVGLMRDLSDVGSEPSQANPKNNTNKHLNGTKKKRERWAAGRACLCKLEGFA